MKTQTSGVRIDAASFEKDDVSRLRMGKSNTIGLPEPWFSIGIAFPRLSWATETYPQRTRASQVLTLCLPEI